MPSRKPVDPIERWRRLPAGQRKAVLTAIGMDARYEMEESKRMRQIGYEDDARRDGLRSRAFRAAQSALRSLSKKGKSRRAR